MNRGIVMEMKAKTLIVMAPDGHFSEIPRASRQCQVGEEIVYAEPSVRLWNRKPVAWTSGLVAAAVFCLVVFSGMQGAFASPEVVAYVSMDINPSVELGIDAKEKVRELRGLNSDGNTLIQNLDYKGKSVTDLTEELLKRADDTVLKDKDTADIVIASTKVKPDAKLDESQVADQLEEQVKQHAEKNYPKKEVEVTAFPAPQEARQAAQEEQLSTGKLAIYLKAVENGQDVTIDDFKTKSVHDIAAAYGGIGKLIGEQPIRKTEIEKLVQENLNGTLKNQANDGKKEDSKNNGSAKKNGEKAVLPSASPKTTKKPTPTPTKPPAATPTGSRNSPGKSGKQDNGPSDNGKSDNGKNEKTNRNETGSSSNDNKNPSNNKTDDSKGNDKNNKNDNKNDNEKSKEASKPAEVSSLPAGDHSPSDKPDASGNQKNDKEKKGNDNSGNDTKNGEAKPNERSGTD